MFEFFRHLFAADYMAHGYCYRWDSSVLWLNVISDGAIAASYYAIPLVLFSFARRRKDLGFQWIFVAFGMFILACGTTHLMGVWTVWNGAYRLEGVIKAVTAVASAATAILLVPLVPKLAALPSPDQMRAINAGLEKEIEERKKAEAGILHLNAELEMRVGERTSELREANLQLSTANAGLRDEIEKGRSLEKQLFHAQKMEAVGRLAGGVAHDFNNLLTVILGFTEVILAAPQDAALDRSQLEEVRNAGLKATSLTRQLLAFSRRQVLTPRVLDLNATVSDIEKMLRRLLGEHIEVATLLRRGVGLVKVDPSQVEQVLMNLAVNARDAMPNGGKLTIETANVHLDEAYCREHVDAEPGAYVMLAITDTGHGMDEETKAHIFEPFFTTKDPGKGTGLGLSTVFGIVKQSGGSVWVYSEPGQGTVFKVYFPRVEGVADAAPKPQEAGARGTETVLVCEDDEKVRALVRTVLDAHGYTVLEAGSAREALLFRSRYTGPIDLLLTDLVLPQVSGRELANQILAIMPGIKVLLMSGYTETALEPGVEFVQKPFTPEVLCRRVREVLDKQPGTP
ncbi:MAG TPA: ATP-binding protein [Bryobacteraceae bacterium]